MKGKIVTGLIAGAIFLGTYLTYDYKLEQLQEKHDESIRKYESLNQGLKSQFDSERKFNIELGEKVKMLEKDNAYLEDEMTSLNDTIKTQQRIIQEFKEKEQKQKEMKQVSRGTENIKRSLYVTATAYTSFCPTGCIGVTATGINVKNSVTHQGHRVIAVDPNVIPLHSLVKVYPKDREPFYAYAGDTGGRIKGNRIDFLISVNDRAAAYQFGKQRDIKVEIIREGK